MRVPDDRLEVVVERILPGGMGLAHVDGRTVFVALSAPGDRLSVKVDRVKGSVAFASINRELSSHRLARVEPPCPYFGQCGGCNFSANELPGAARRQERRSSKTVCAASAAFKTSLSLKSRPRRISGITGSRAQWQYDAARSSAWLF